MALPGPTCPTWAATSHRPSYHPPPCTTWPPSAQAAAGPHGQRRASWGAAGGTMGLSRHALNGKPFEKLSRTHLRNHLESDTTSQQAGLPLPGATARTPTVPAALRTSGSTAARAGRGELQSNQSGRTATGSRPDQRATARPAVGPGPGQPAARDAARPRLWHPCRQRAPAAWCSVHSMEVD